MEGLDVQVPGHSAAYRLVKSSSGAHIGFAFIRKDQAVEGLDSSCALKLERLDSSETRVGSKEGRKVPPLTNIDLEDCDQQLPDTSSSSSVQVLLSDQNTKNSEPQASLEEAVATDHAVDTSMSIIFDSNIDVKTRIKTMAQEMLRSLKEVKEPPRAPVSKSGRGIPGGTRPNTNLFQEHHIDSADIDPNRFNNTGTLNKNRRVKCKLCSKVLIKPNFGTHMKKFHLPDEECSFCGEEFPAMTISSHQRKCFGVKRGDREEGRSPGRFQKKRLEFSATDTGTDAEPVLTSLATQGPVSGGSGAVTGHIGASTNESEDVPRGSEGSALGGSEEMEAVPGGAKSGAVPGVTEAVQEGAGGVPGCTGAVPGEAEAVPGGAGDVPGGAGAVPGGTGAVIGGAVAVPGGKGMVSGEAGAVLGETGAVLGGAGAVPRDYNEGQEISMVGIMMKFGNKSFKVLMPKRKMVKKAMRKIAARLGKEIGVLSFTVEGGRKLQGQEVMEGLEGKVIVVTED